LIELAMKPRRVHVEFTNIDKSVIVHDDQLDIPERTVLIAEEFMSEFDILGMSAQDEFYATRGRTTFGAGSIYPRHRLRAYQTQTRMVASTDVVGNIGEGLGIATFAHITETDLDGFIRLKRRKNLAKKGLPRKCPDFFIPGAFSVPSALCAKLQIPPGRLRGREIPVECKGLTTNNIGRPFSSALWQIVEFWSVLAHMGQSPKRHLGFVVTVFNIATTGRGVRISTVRPKLSDKDWAAGLMKVPEGVKTLETWETVFGEPIEEVFF